MTDSTQNAPSLSRSDRPDLPGHISYALYTGYFLWFCVVGLLTLYGLYILGSGEGFGGVKAFGPLRIYSLALLLVCLWLVQWPLLVYGEHLSIREQMAWGLLLLFLPPVALASYPRLRVTWRASCAPEGGLLAGRKGSEGFSLGSLPGFNHGD